MVKQDCLRLEQLLQVSLKGRVVSFEMRYYSLPNILSLMLRIVTKVCWKYFPIWISQHRKSHSRF